MNIMETMKTISELAKKSMSIELQEKIMELREQVISLKEENIHLRDENLSLKQDIALSTQGERCPKCKKGTWELISSKPHHIMGDVGVLEREYKCSECGFTETIPFNPHKK